MATNKKVDTTTMVRVDKKIHKKVKTEVKNKRSSIGEFYDEAVSEKLKVLKSWKPIITQLKNSK